MVKTPTRVDDIFVFITKIPHSWPKIKAAKNLIRSDHKSIVYFCIFVNSTNAANCNLCLPNIIVVFFLINVYLTNLPNAYFT